MYWIEYFFVDNVDGEVVFFLDEVVCCVRKWMGEGDYNVFISNCEYFCWECKVGKLESY